MAMIAIKANSLALVIGYSSTISQSYEAAFTAASFSLVYLV